MVIPVELRPDPFEGCWRRLERAKFHAKEAADEWNSFIDDDEAFSSGLDAAGDGTYSLWIAQEAPPPPSIALAMGEYFYQLRATLDNCLYVVAACDTGQYPPPKAQQLQFPVYETEEAWIDNEFRLKPLSDRHKQWCRELQPFLSDSLHPRLTMLGLVNDLARKDRHRQLHVMGSYASDVNPIVDAPSASKVEWVEVHRKKALEDKTVVATFRVTPHSPGDSVRANPNLVIDLELSEVAALRSSHTEKTWLDAPFAERVAFTEITFQTIVGRFERDITGSTRCKHLRQETEIEAIDEPSDDDDEDEDDGL